MVDLHEVGEFQARTNFLVPSGLEVSQADLEGAQPRKVIRLTLIGDESLALVLWKIISSTKLLQDESLDWRVSIGK